MWILAFLHYKYQKLGKIESLCIVYFNMLDPTSSKKDLEQSRRVSLAVAHNHTAADICRQYGGRVVKNIGDLLMAAFHNPLEGMLASLELAEKINKEKLPFRTRSAFIHGIVTQIDNNGTDYIGKAVDRCSHLIELALPGQILTDESTMDMIEPFTKSFQEMVSRFVGVKNLAGAGKVPVYEVALENLGFVEEGAQHPGKRPDDPMDAGENTEAAPIESQGRDLPPLAVPDLARQREADRPLEAILRQCTPDQSELEAVSMGYRNLCHILEKAYDLHVRQVNFSGSFSRGTMIRPLQPVDIMAVVSPPPGQEKNVTETLEDFKRFMTRKSPGTEAAISRGRVSLVMHSVEFCLIPVLAALEKGRAQLFIPSTEGGFWIARNPAVPELWMKSAAEKNGPSFLPFIRLIKAWQRTNCSYLNSLHLEMLTGLIASRVKLDLSLEAVYLWFKTAYALITQNKTPFISDPGREGEYIDDYIYSNANTFARFGRVITESYGLARQGITYHRAGDTKTSLAHWKTLFGFYLAE